MDAIANLFGGGIPRGAQAAAGVLGPAAGAFGPYEQAGQSALAQYMQALGGMGDPHQFYQRMMAGYTTSPQAHQQMQNMMRASNAAAAASGMLGSGAQQKALQTSAQGITAADQQRYLDNMMNIYGQHMGGLANISGMGLRGAGGAAGLEEALAQARMAEQTGRAQGKSGAIGGLTGLLGDVGGEMGLPNIPGMFPSF